MLASRLHWRLLIGTIVVLMAVAWLTPIWVRPPDIQENRVLAPKPAWPRGFADLKTFRKAADAYVADHFGVRPHLIGALNRVRMLVGVSGSKRVIVGRDGWLFFDDDTHLGAARGDPPMTGPQVRAWLMALAAQTEFVQAHGAHYLVVTPPAKETIYPDHGPAWYAGPNPNRPTLVLPRLAQASGAGEVLYLYPRIAQATKAGQKTFSRHDTHWSGYGAYAGYVGLMTRLRALGLMADAPRPLSDFRKIDLAPNGSPRDLALMLGVASLVHIDYPHLDNPAGEDKIAKSYLSARTDWTGPQVIDTGEVGKPVLMMVRDSFSNALVPFLYSHFSRIVLTHNADGFWRPDMIERFKPDIVILEVIEAGLRVGVGDGPEPSAAAVARIDHVLGQTAPAGQGPQGNFLAALKPPDARTAAILSAAAPSGNCNIEVASLKPGAGGEATLTTSGWMSELGAKITSPDGLVVLKGPSGPLVGSVKMDKKRPDVAAYYKNHSGEASGFVATFLIQKIAAGTYTPVVYRRAGRGWIACAGKPSIIAP